MAKYGNHISPWVAYKAGLASRANYGTNGWKKHRPRSGDMTFLVMWQNQNNEVVYHIMRGDFTITDRYINFYSTLNFTVVPLIGGSKPTISMRKKIVLPLCCSIYKVCMHYPRITLGLLYKPVGPPCYPMITIASPDDRVEDAPAPAPAPTPAPAPAPAPTPAPAPAPDHSARVSVLEGKIRDAESLLTDLTKQVQDAQRHIDELKMQ
jgi:hypothetical protein